jgi:hypothetical protein
LFRLPVESRLMKPFLRRLLKVLTCLSLIVIGIFGTLAVQSVAEPRRMATVPSPDGSLVLVVERYGIWVLPARRTFRVCEYGNGQIGEVTDGSIFVYHEYDSGGFDMSHMKTYWRGKTAVVEFESVRLERTWPDRDWQMIDVPPAAVASQPTTTLPTTRTAGAESQSK